MEKITFVCPTGIGDVAWCLLKMRAIAQPHQEIHVRLASCDPSSEIDRRALPLLKRFRWIESADLIHANCVNCDIRPTDERGRYNYFPDGWQGSNFWLMPNRPLEHGERIENWLPDYPMDWDVFYTLDWSGSRAGIERGRQMGKFVAFYLGPEAGNTTYGHNRGLLWTPLMWTTLAQRFIDQGCRIAVVGATWDLSYWQKYIRPAVQVAEQEDHWSEFLGTFEIGETLAFLSTARCLIGYQSGLTVVNHYLGGKGMAWWRPDGNSACPHYHVAFDERMKDAWIRPSFEANWKGLIYGRETPDDIFRTAVERGWLDD